MLLRVDNISSRYGRIPALRDVSIAVSEGEFVSLIGANGAGKTTLLNVICGIQPLTTGCVEFDGIDLARVAGADRVRRGIVQVPEGRQIFAPLTVRENLELGAYTRPLTRVKSLIEHIFSVFPVLASRAGAAAGALSGGEQQMLAIGRALMAEPRLLLLDEPSLGLAPQMIAFIFDRVRELNAGGMSVLLVEQNASLALANANRAYVLETGRVAMDGTGLELLGHPDVQSIYLGA